MSDAAGPVGKFPDDPLEAFAQSYRLACDEILSVKDRPAIIGLCGPQGSGKTYMAERLVDHLGQRGIRAVARSLDDFYLSKASRLQLAEHIHPLLATRGVPGTHDLGLLHELLDQLASADASDRTPLPQFDKLDDDRAPAREWSEFRGRPDAIIIEGWCLGARAQTQAALRLPINSLEATEDSNAIWRGYVNHQLAGSYRRLFARFDRNIVLHASSFDRVFGWRKEQEDRLHDASEVTLSPMSAAELNRFIAHYERLTRWIMEDRPGDLIIGIDGNRKPTTWERR